MKKYRCALMVFLFMFAGISCSWAGYYDEGHFGLTEDDAYVIDSIADNVAHTFGVSYVELMSAIVATSFAAAISPLSTGGAIIMSSYSASKETTTEEMNNMFKTLFLLSVANVAINVLMSWLGVFNLGHLFY